MPATPDRFPGQLEDDEGILLTPQLATPTVDGQIKYVTAVGFQFRENGVTKSLTGSGVPLYDYLLENDPSDLNNTTYVLTYASGNVTQELWKYTATNLTVKTSAYTYSSGRVQTAIDTVYGPDGTTIVAQQTTTYSYSGSRVSGYTRVRNV